MQVDASKWDPRHPVDVTLEPNVAQQSWAMLYVYSYILRQKKWWQSASTASTEASSVEALYAWSSRGHIYIYIYLHIYIYTIYIYICVLYIYIFISLSIYIYVSICLCYIYISTSLCLYVHMFTPFSKELPFSVPDGRSGVWTRGRGGEGGCEGTFGSISLWILTREFEGSLYTKVTFQYVFQKKRKKITNN